MVFERRKDKEGNHIGDSPYPLVIQEGDIFPLRLKKDDLKRFVDEGSMSQETADKICETVKFEMSIPPQDEEKPKTQPSKKSKSSDEVDF